MTSARSGRPGPSVALSDNRALKRLKADDQSRDRALQIFVDILTAFPASFTLTEKIETSCEVVCASAPSLVAAVATRKTPTLAKRSGSLRAYARWLRSQNAAEDDFMSEPLLYGFLHYLSDSKAGGTTGLALLAALNFAHGVLESVAPAPTGSARIRGLAATLARRRHCRGPRDPLTVEMVAYLENLAIDAVDDFEGVFAGAASFAVLARLRAGDLVRCHREPVIDEGPEGMGFIDTVFWEHKTAKPGARAALPVVAPLLGVTGRACARAWLKRRRAAGLDADADGTLIPAPALGGGWAGAPMITEEFGRALTAILKKGGFGETALARIGAHSCKCTALSWAAKAAVPRDDRRALGYHAKQGDRTMESYSRDSMAGPLRELMTVLSKIRGKRFMPDLTRSGYLAGPEPSSPTCSTRSSTSPSSDGSIGEQAKDKLNIDGAPEVVDGLTPEFVYNKTTKYLHLAASPEHLVCGKRYPVKAELYIEPLAGARRCSKCF